MEFQYPVIRANMIELLVMHRLYVRTSRTQEFTVYERNQWFEIMHPYA